MRAFGSWQRNHRFKPVALAAATIMLASCGGGDDSTSGGPGTAPSAPTAQPQKLTGTAATGAAFAGGRVSVTDANGNAACQATTSSLLTDAAGVYTCLLVDNAKAPFAIVVSDPNNLQSPQVSLVRTAPAAGQTAVANVTPLTTALLAIASGKLTLADLLGSPAAITALTATSDADLKAALATLVAQIKPLLDQAGITNTAGFDPVATPIVAGSGTGTDQVLDNVRLSSQPFDDGSGNAPTMVLMLSNPLAPSATPVPLGTKGDTAPQSVPSSTVSGSDVAAAAALGPMFQACFSHPVNERVLATNTSIPLNQGGPEVTQDHADCEQIPFDPNFINSGYRRGQYFYETLTSDDMTGAKFAPVEIMRYFAQPNGDLAVVNIRYVDSKGAGGSFIMNMKKQVDAKWALSGNTRAVDVRVRPVIRRSEQFVPTPETGVFWYSGASRYQTGLDFYVSRYGPGSANLRAVRVKGYGLPAAGLVLSLPSANTCASQSWFNIANKTGNINISDAGPDGSQFGSVFWLQRTWDVQGPSATSVRPNPFAGNLAKSTQTANWSHPGDLGAAAGSTSYLDFSQLVAWTRYTFELFYNNETTPSASYSGPIVSPVIPAAAGASLQWVTLDQAGRKLLDPADSVAGPTSQVTVSWNANVQAEPISSVGFSTTRFSSIGDPATQMAPPVQSAVSTGTTLVAKGSNSVIVRSPGTVNDPNCGNGGQFIGLTNDGLTSRQLQLRYRMFDGSLKDSTSRYN